MSGKPPSSSTKKLNLFQRLNIRFPWLKLATTCFICLVAILDLLGLTISRLPDLDDSFPKAPMQKHAKATERTLAGKKLVALTFDDGPSPATTPALLDILAEKNTLATFFMLGYMARDNPSIVKRISREGHEVASHTMYHQNLIMLPPESIAADVGEASSILKSITGNTPKLTRPPYGNHNNTVRAVINTPIILWSVDPLDWQHKDPSQILSLVQAQIRDGGIILMHDVYPTTVEAVPAVIDYLKNDGYEFVTISELAAARKIKLSSPETYYYFYP